MQSQFDPYHQWLGIQPHEHPVDHYRLLGIARFETDPGLIRSAADQRMTLIRSFQTGPRGTHTQGILNEVSTAKLCLLDQASKASYDEQLHLASSRIASAAAQAPYMPDSPGTAPPAPTPPPPPMTAPPQEAASEPSPDDAGGEQEHLDSWLTQHGATIFLTAFCALAVVAAGCAAFVVLRRRARPSSGPDAPSPVIVESLTPVVVEPIEYSAPVDDRSIVQEGTGEVHFPLSNVQLHGDSITVSEQNGVRAVTDWTKPTDIAEWKFRVVQPGFFKVEVEYAAGAESADSGFSVEVDGKQARFDVLDSGSYQTFRTDFRVLAITKSGEHTLRIAPTSLTGSQLMVLKSVHLVPVRR